MTVNRHSRGTMTSLGYKPVRNIFGHELGMAKKSRGAALIVARLHIVHNAESIFTIIPTEHPDHWHVNTSIETQGVGCPPDWKFNTKVPKQVCCKSCGSTGATFLTYDV